MKEDSRANVSVILALTLVHFIGDFYNAFINPLFPVFVREFSLTLAQIGLIAGIGRFLAFIVQPSVGYLADRYPTRLFILLGPLLSIVFFPLVGAAPGFWALMLFVCLGSVGSSMFHPTTAGMVSDYAGGHFGFSMSIYNMGGTLAFGLGPLFITHIVSSYGLSATPLTMILGLAALPFLFRGLPCPRVEGLKEFGFIGSLREVLGGVWKSIVIIWVVMVLRAYVSQSFLIFMPVMFAEEGYSLVSIGKMVSLFTVAGTASGLIAGHLSDRIGYKPLFYMSYGLTTPALYLLLYLPGNWVYLSVLVAGFVAMATLPLGVAMAQELAPKGRSMVSSIMMGLAFGTGGMITPLTGTLADIYGIRTVLAVLAIIPFLTIGLIFLLPETRNKPYHPSL